MSDARFYHMRKQIEKGTTHLPEKISEVMAGIEINQL